MLEQDEDWFDYIDEKMMTFKNKIHDWIRDAEHERKEQLSSRSRSVTSKHSSSRKSSSSSPSRRSSKDRALQEKLWEWESRQLRKFNLSLIKQPLHEKTVNRNQTNFTRWAPSKPTLERYKKVNVLDSEDGSEIFWKLLKLQAAPEVDMEPFDGNVLSYHHFMALFMEFVKSKAEDPRERLIRLLMK